MNQNDNNLISPYVRLARAICAQDPHPSPIWLQIGKGRKISRLPLAVGTLNMLRTLAHRSGRPSSVATFLVDAVHPTITEKQSSTLWKLAVHSMDLPFAVEKRIEIGITREGSAMAFCGPQAFVLVDDGWLDANDKLWPTLRDAASSPSSPAMLQPKHEGPISMEPRLLFQRQLDGTVVPIARSFLEEIRGFSTAELFEEVSCHKILALAPWMTPAQATTLAHLLAVKPEPDGCDYATAKTIELEIIVASDGLGTATLDQFVPDNIILLSANYAEPTPWKARHGASPIAEASSLAQLLRAIVQGTQPNDLV